MVRSSNHGQSAEVAMRKTGTETQRPIQPPVKPNHPGGLVVQTGVPPPEWDRTSQVIAVFRSYDVNGDGVMDRTELASLMWKIHPTLTDTQMAVAFDQVDSNRDGRISYEEFIAWVFSDEQLLAELRSSPKTPRNRQVRVTALNGQSVILRVSPNECVRDVRLRTCCWIGLPVKSANTLELICNSKALQDNEKVAELPQWEIQVLQRTFSSIFGACGRSILGWSADTLKSKLEIPVPGQVKRLLHLKELGVLVAVHGSSDIVAWEVKSKHVLWKTNTKSEIASFVSNQTTVFVGTEDGMLFANDAKTGDRTWQAQAKDNIDGVQVLAISQSPKVLFGGTDSGRVFAWNGENGQELWRSQHTGDMPEVKHFALTVVGDVVFSGDNNGSLFAWNTRTGKKLWNEKPESTSATIALAYFELRDAVIRATSCGLLAGFNGHSGELLFSVQIVALKSIISCKQDRLYLATAKRLLCWDIETREEVWSTDVLENLGFHITKCVFADDTDTVCVGTFCCSSSSSFVRAFDAGTGACTGTSEDDGDLRALVYAPPD